MPTTRHVTEPLNTDFLAERLETLADRTARGRHVHGLLLAVAADDGAACRAAGGDADLEAPYFVASISKMYTAAIIGQLVDRQQLRYDDLVVDLLPDLDLRGLHRLDGVDATSRLCVRHLLDQTSGIADYFIAGGIEKDLAAGNDRSYGIADVVDLARQAGPEFAPGDRDGGRAGYSDTNYLLLTAIIEAVTGDTYATAVQRRIATPLGLTRTYVYDGRDTAGILPIHHRNSLTSFPHALASEQGAGGLVSTLDEQVRFSRAFHGGELFDLERPRFNRVFFNVDYGGGTMRFQVPRWMMLGARMPELIGHSGWTGSFLFHSRELGVHLAGTFNQIDSPVRPFRLLPKLTRIVEAAHDRS